MEPAPDAALWTRALRGDASAFGELFSRHATTIYNYCFRRTADWTTAEDLTSVVFMEAWRRRAELRPHGDSALPLLYGVATNVLRNNSRSMRRYRAALARVPPPERRRSVAEEVEARVDAQRRMARVLDAIERLPRREQEVIALCVMSGLSYEDAAAALDVPVGTIRSRLSSARERLGRMELEVRLEPDGERTTRGGPR